MDRPVPPNTFGSPGPDPERYENPVSNPEQIDPPGGYAHMPPSAPDPVEGSTAPMTGDVPPMRTPSTMHRFDPWNYREGAGVGDGAEVVGFRVEAVDGHIGKIDEASTLVGDSYLVVDTGPWIFGKKVLLPAGTVTHVDPIDQKVYVDRTKEQIKNSPEYDPETFRDQAYRDKVGGYYGTTYSSANPGDYSSPNPGDYSSPNPDESEFPR
jgi:hypothetical protein